MSSTVKFIKSLKVWISNFKIKEYKKTDFDRKMIIYPFRLIVRPFDTVSDIKYEGMGSVLIANIILGIFFITNILTFFYEGFIFNTNKITQFNIFSELLYSVIVVSLWCIVNWSVCTLMDGEGRFPDIFIVTCYALTPKIIGQIIALIISNIIVYEEAVYIQAILAVSNIIMAALIVIGMLTVHQFTLLKTLISIAFTVLGIMVIIFLGILFFSIVQQMYNFIQTIFMEYLNKS